MELLDVYDEADRVHLGVKDRAAVHRDGDWHRCFHLWIACGDGVLLQRRAESKDVFPGMLDTTAAGHLTAGETVADGLREVEEELGVSYELPALTDLGVHSVEDRTTPGIVDREHHYVFVVRDERPLEAYTDFDRVELAGLTFVSLAAFATLAGGTACAGLEWDGTVVRETAFSPDELVPVAYLAPLMAALRG